MGRFLLALGLACCQEAPDPAGCRSDGTLGACCDEAPCLEPLVCRAVGDREACTVACDAESGAGCPDGSVCVAQAEEAVCVPTGGVVGQGCSFTDDCRPGLICENRFPGGYCTAPCEKGTPCPSGVGDARCVRLSGDFGAFCLAPCTTSADCAPGAECTAVGGSGVFVCFPNFEDG